jgi:hypothetical protein
MRENRYLARFLRSYLAPCMQSHALEPHYPARSELVGQRMSSGSACHNGRRPSQAKPSPIPSRSIQEPSECQRPASKSVNQEPTTAQLGLTPSLNVAGLGERRERTKQAV